MCRSGSAGNSLSASGGVCTDAGPALPASLLTKAAAGQPVRVATIAIGPSAVKSTAAARQANTQAVAQGLSAALRTRVSEADAGSLTKAYAANDFKTIQTIMARYPQWKTLDARTKISYAGMHGAVRRVPPACCSCARQVRSELMPLQQEAK